MPQGSRGHIEGFQTRQGSPLGEQFPYGDAPDQERAYHGSPVPGLNEIKPGSEVGWVNHEVSHPKKVYAAVGSGAEGEREAWSQASMAGSRKLGEYMGEHGTTPPIEDAPRPTVYDVTMRGSVDTDPEYDQNPFAQKSIRADRASVNREIPMPKGAQGTLLPDYFGRSGSFAEGFRDTLLSEDTGGMVTGARFEMPDSGPDSAVEEHVAPGNARRAMDVEPAKQMTAMNLDRQGIANFPVEDEPLTYARQTGEHPSPQLFNPATESADMSSNFPYGRLGGWESRRKSFWDKQARW